MAWLSFWRQPSVTDIDAQGDSIRRLSVAVLSERTRASAARAFQKRGPTLPNTSISIILKALEEIRPLDCDGEDACAALVQARDVNGPDATLASLPPCDSVRIAAAAVACADFVSRNADIKATEAERQLHTLMTTLSAPSYEKLLRMELMTRTERPLLTLPFLDLSGSVAREYLLAAINCPTLVWIDLTGCCIDDAFIEGPFLDVIGGHQHLGVLSLAHNRFSRRVSQSLAARLRNPDYAPALLRVFIRDGNDGDPGTFDAIDHILSQRGLEFSAAVDSIERGIAQRKYRALSLDGGGMRAVAQLEWLMRLERSLPAGNHIGEEFDLVVASSWGAVIACALALRRPLAQVAEFFRTVSETVFCEGLREGEQSYSYSLAVVRSARSWWTRGGWYPDAPFLAALERLFGETRFDFPFMHVVIPLKEEHTGTLVVASSWELRSVPLQRIDMVQQMKSRGHSHSILVRDVVAAAMSTPSLLAPRPLLVPNTGTDIKSTLSTIFGAKPVEPTYCDALGILPNPFGLAIAEMHSRAHESLGRDNLIVSLGCAPPPTPQGSNEGSAAVLASSLRCFEGHQNIDYVRLSLTSQHTAAANAASVSALQHPPQFLTRRVEPLPTGAALARIDEPNPSLLDAVRASCIFSPLVDW